MSTISRMIKFTIHLYLYLPPQTIKDHSFDFAILLQPIWGNCEAVLLLKPPSGVLLFCCMASVLLLRPHWSQGILKCCHRCSIEATLEKKTYCLLRCLKKHQQKLKSEQQWMKLNEESKIMNWLQTLFLTFNEIHHKWWICVCVPMAQQQWSSQGHNLPQTKVRGRLSGVSWEE